MINSFRSEAFKWINICRINDNYPLQNSTICCRECPGHLPCLHRKCITKVEVLACPQVCQKMSFSHHHFPYSLEKGTTSPKHFYEIPWKQCSSRGLFSSLTRPLDLLDHHVSNSSGFRVWEHMRSVRCTGTGDWNQDGWSVTRGYPKSVFKHWGQRSKVVCAEDRGHIEHLLWHS